ncbi:MAG TPA: hypothetical protein VGL81_36190 [Polyangiaceae bacterium]|jgi:hypothetical protein
MHVCVCRAVTDETVKSAIVNGARTSMRPYGVEVEVEVASDEHRLTESGDARTRSGWPTKDGLACFATTDWQRFPCSTKPVTAGTPWFTAWGQ